MTHNLWLDGIEAPPRAALDGALPPLDGDTDVAIVGAGFTGLWTAYYLRQLAPGLRVLVIEAAHAGYGASGRNGGWCSAELPVSLTSLAARHGRPAAAAMQQAARDASSAVWPARSSGMVRS
jgi:glycine/D-amino acid oxidase-like deaminating enzyme